MKNKQTKIKEGKNLKLEKFQVSEIKDQREIAGGLQGADDFTIFWPK